MTKKEALERAKNLTDEQHEIVYGILMNSFGDGQERDMLHAILDGCEPLLPDVVDLITALDQYEKDEADQIK